MKIHIVQKGDTLWELSKKYGVDFEALKSANSQLSSPDMIMPGMKIRIPTTAKMVKKEMVKKEAPIKEQVQMPMKELQVETPYKDISPKPMPVVKEDDIKAQLNLKPEMPMPQMPQIPQMQTPPMMQATTIEQDLYMQFNFQESDSSEEVEHMEQPQQQPMFHQPMYQPVQMIPCYPVHPCCYGMPPIGHHGFPMHHPHGIAPMAHPGMMMPIQEDYNDCGCGGNNYQVPQMGEVPQFNLGMNMYNSQVQENMPQMGSNMTIPGMSGFQSNGFPSPPGFGELRMHEDESSD
ncbi:SafA/ExsA family spore coat assembly protein [Paucisalibacillus sp. EB02]|uniref:SafA/ExsA family spore coat assembly protein n=1 Tax=Paucisalibacillus sp. EB02 TaxID=1347087 RepID=UPI0004B75B7A|nr:SafA/ExsA family spore coat assembly protein [Paucisalibacillus sp. EB02]